MSRGGADKRRTESACAPALLCSPLRSHIPAVAPWLAGEARAHGERVSRASCAGRRTPRCSCPLATGAHASWGLWHASFVPFTPVSQVWQRQCRCTLPPSQDTDMELTGEFDASASGHSDLLRCRALTVLCTRWQASFVPGIPRWIHQLRSWPHALRYAVAHAHAVRLRPASRHGRLSPLRG